MSEKYRGIVDLMHNFLSFNPFFRMTALEAIKLKVFDPVRNPKKEKLL